MNVVQAYTIMFLTGGFVYAGIEVLARGYSHISMFFAGGLCFLLVGLVENILGNSASFVSQMVICGLMITLVELAIGLVVNQKLHLGVWDYSEQQYNLKGQICLLFTNLWILLSGPVILLHDFMRYFLLGTSMPHYKIF